MDEHEEEESLSTLNKVLMIIGIILYIVAIVLSKNSFSKIIYIISYILIGYDIILKALKHLFSKDMFDENLIMSIATIGAIIIGQYNESIAVLVLYKIGEILQDKAVDSSKEKIEKVLDLKINTATLKNGESRNIEDVKIGDVVLVKTGDKVPLDCILESNNATLDMSALNGESTYVDVEEGKEVLAGSINVGSAIYLKVIREEKQKNIYQNFAKYIHLL